MKKHLLSGKYAVIFIHAAVWLLIFLIPILLRDAPEKKSHMAYYAGWQFHNLINIVSWIALFYLNAYWLIPKFFFPRKFWQYITLVVLVLIFLFLLNYSSYRILVPQGRYTLAGFWRFYLIPCLFVLATSTVYTMVYDRLKMDKAAAQRETLNLKTELDFLRSQISPHFMFNMLNNMVSLARKKSDLLEVSLINLSSMLRYMLYESASDSVPLTKEIEYIESYIDLQKQRFENQVKVTAVFDNGNDNYCIAPMLLIVFVENAFKYGVGVDEGSVIDIRLRTEKGILTFEVRNRFSEEDRHEGEEHPRIGLNNLQRRLNLLYPDKHTLSLNSSGGWFTVLLQLTLH